MPQRNRVLDAALAAACGLALLPLAGCGTDAEPGGDMDAGADAGTDGGAFDAAAHLIAAEDAGAEGNFFDIEDVAELTAPVEGDYVADWGEVFYFIFAAADGFYTQFLGEVNEGETYHLDLDGIPDYPSAVAGVIFAAQDFYAPSLVKEQPIHAIGPGGLEFDFATDALGRYGLHDLPPGSYTLQLDFHDADITLQISSGDGLAYDDLFFDDPEQLD